MPDFRTGKQPCQNYTPRDELNGTNVHECWAPFDEKEPPRCCESGGLVSFCEACNRDHHSNGYETCSGWAKPLDTNEVPVKEHAFGSTILNASERAKLSRAELMPTERDAILHLQEALVRLKELGWQEATYCPKDGTEFVVIEAGSTGIHDARYSGQWPDGHLLIYAGGDIWPTHVGGCILWRPK